MSTTIWLGLFFGSLGLIIIILLVRSLRLRNKWEALHHEVGGPTWYHPHLPAHTLHIISPKTLVRIGSFGLFVFITVLEEILERIINKLKGVSKKLIGSIDSMERKHYKKYHNANSQKASFQDGFEKHSQNGDSVQ